MLAVEHESHISSWRNEYLDWGVRDAVLYQNPEDFLDIKSNKEEVFQPRSEGCWILSVIKGNTLEHFCHLIRAPKDYMFCLENQGKIEDRRRMWRKKLLRLQNLCLSKPKFFRGATNRKGYQNS